MTTYTYRHKTNGRLAAVIGNAENVVCVQCQGKTRPMVWRLYKLHQWYAPIEPVEVEDAPKRQRKDRRRLGQCACGNPAAEIMLLTVHNRPQRYRLCAECAALERQT